MTTAAIDQTATELGIEVTIEDGRVYAMFLGATPTGVSRTEIELSPNHARLLAHALLDAAWDVDKTPEQESFVAGLEKELADSIAEIHDAPDRAAEIAAHQKHSALRWQLWSARHSMSHEDRP